MKNLSVFLSLRDLIFESQLTDYQKDIAILYAVGYPIDTIAELNGIKPVTVRHHLNIVRLTFGEASLSSLRSIIFLRAFSNVFLSCKNCIYQRFG